MADQPNPADGANGVSHFTRNHSRETPKRIFVVVALVVVGIVIRWFISGWHIESTDDAFVDGHIYPVSSRVGGYVSHVYVKSNQRVHAGDVLFDIDPGELKTAAEHAGASVSEHEAEMRRLTNEAMSTGKVTLAQQEEAAAASKSAWSNAMQGKQRVAGAAARVRSMEAERAASRTVAEGETNRVSASAALSKAVQATRIAAEADLASSRQQLQVDEAQLSEAKDGVKLAEVDLASAKNEVDRAESRVSAAEAGVRSANARGVAVKAEFQKAHDDSARVAKLFDQGAVSQQALQAAQTTAVAAESKVSEANEAAVAASAERDVTRSSLEVARNHVKQAEAQLRQAQTATVRLTAQTVLDEKRIAAAEANVRKESANVEAAQATIGLTRSNALAARAQVRGKAASVEENQSKLRETVAGAGDVMGRLQKARALGIAASARPYQVNAAGAAAQAANAKKDEARADLTLARLRLGYTRVCAPADGLVTRKSVEVGQYVEAGQPLLAIVSLTDTWIAANFKETQLHTMRVGQSVDLQVDAYPDRSFHGRVDSISAGTGSRFSLLPPENATGNFVKVVQRVPVKIALDDRERNADRPLRVGMNVVVRVHTR